MMFFPERGRRFFRSNDMRARRSSAGRDGCRYHREAPQIDIGGEEIRRGLQKGLHVRSPHVDVQALARTPVLGGEPGVVIVERLGEVMLGAFGFGAGWPDKRGEAGARRPSLPGS